MAEKIPLVFDPNVGGPGQLQSTDTLAGVAEETDFEKLTRQFRLTLFFLASQGIQLPRELRREARKL